jgi:hypothetical protein
VTLNNEDFKSSTLRPTGADQPNCSKVILAQPESLDADHSTVDDDDRTAPSAKLVSYLSASMEELIIMMIIVTFVKRAIMSRGWKVKFKR